MQIARILRILMYFSVKTNSETETSVLGHEKTKTDTKFKIPQPSNTKCVDRFNIFGEVIKLQVEMNEICSILY